VSKEDVIEVEGEVELN